MGRSCTSLELNDVQFVAAVDGVVTALLVRATQPPGGVESVKVSLYKNGAVVAGMCCT
eukprot:SAG22_NODE_1129_length_5458_cov_33.388692_5_plen_58_part_00